MARLTFGYILLLLGLAGLILPIIPGLILIAFGLNLVAETSFGDRMINQLKSRRPFSWFMASFF